MGEDQKHPVFYKLHSYEPVIQKEPKGTVLIISPFNFPLYLSLLPVVHISFEMHSMPTIEVDSG